ncbi:MAG TPA: NAD(P)-binding domain-containing protein [Nostocaceae cyanobacterium]|nr:NAD(P)-binding domain-containing protein [Nostocaceae cyanobacterium]
MPSNFYNRNPSLLTNKLHKTCRVAVIGGGASGITTAKCLRDDNHEPVVFESNDQIGGIWAFKEAPGGTFKSLYFQNSKYLSAFSDYPMNTCVSDFPHNNEVLKYLNEYIDHFKIRDCIRLNTTVEKVKYQDNLWYVTVKSVNGVETHEFDAIAVCSGVFSKAKIPKLPNQEKFTGKVIHAQDYKEPSIFSGKDVVILGNGASGVDISVSASYTANKVIWSFRKNTWLLPRYLGGIPIDCHLKRIYDLVPSQLRSFIATHKFADISSQHESCNLLPKFDVLSSIVSVNDDILNRVRLGAIQVKPSIINFEGNRVIFQDGTSANADIVVLATGYDVNFPFFDSPIVDVHTEGVDLYKHVFHPYIPNCAFIGIIRVLGAAFPCAEIQARWFSKVLSGEVSLPSPEQMQVEIQNQSAQQKKNWITSIYRSFQVKQLEYIDEIAGLINARPKLWRHWNLISYLLTGPKLPTQFRLDGPNSWTGAEDWIRTVPQLLKKSRKRLVK